MLWASIQIAQWFARAGGGGSSGGSSGGGGSSHSSGGSSYHSSSSSSGGSTGPTPWWVWLIFAGFWVFFIGIFVFVFGYAAKKAAKYAADQNRAQKDIALAASTDPVWAKLIDSAKQVFIQFQKDWQNFDLTSMRTYMTKPYFEHVSLMMTALRNLGRTNTMTDVKIFSAQVDAVTDKAGVDTDTAAVSFTATAEDRLVRTEGGEILTRSNEIFSETWKFTRSANKWKLDGIKQATEQPGSLVSQLRDFAASHNLYFSPDWGRLLLPQRGQLFGGASFEQSDINNHCIGLHNKILIEIYTYVPNVLSTSTNYTIAQATLPKSYGNIIVRKKQGGLFNRVKGLQKISMEWEDFNKRYEVFASDEEQVTSFELLHPVFMEKLFALPFSVNIEAVDNVVYLYTNDSDVQYEQMLSVLNDAFKELKL